MCARSRVLVLLALATLFPLPALAQSSPAAVPVNPLAPLARLVGDWRGQIKLLDDTVIEARNVFDWGLGGKTIQFRAYGIRSGKETLVYEGLYGWDAGLKKIVFREHAAYGSTLDGVVEPEGDSLRFFWTQSTAAGRAEYRAVFRFPDADSFVSQTERKTENGWERFTLESPFAREKQSAPTATAAGEPWQRSLRKQITVAAPLAEVWNAWTTTDGVTGFFGPAAKIEARVGGPYEVYFAPGQPEGLRGSEGCKVHSLAPMKLLAFEWNAPPTIPAIRDSGVHTLVYVELEGVGPGLTRVRMTHTGWGVGAEWDKTYAYFDRAWDAVLSNLNYRFTVGRVEWPGTFVRAEQQSKPTP